MPSSPSTGLPVTLSYRVKLQQRQQGSSAILKVAEGTGIEPVHDGIKVHCLTSLANPLEFSHLAARTDLATYFAVTPEFRVVDSARYALPYTVKPTCKHEGQHMLKVVGEVGFEPTKHTASDLQSDNFEPLVYSPVTATSVMGSNHC